MEPFVDYGDAAVADYGSYDATLGDEEGEEEGDDAAKQKSLFRLCLLCRRRGSSPAADAARSRGSPRGARPRSGDSASGSSAERRRRRRKGRRTSRRPPSRRRAERWPPPPLVLVREGPGVFRRRRIGRRFRRFGRSARRPRRPWAAARALTVARRRRVRMTRAGLLVRMTRAGLLSGTHPGRVLRVAGASAATVVPVNGTVRRRPYSEASKRGAAVSVTVLRGIMPMHAVWAGLTSTRYVRKLWLTRSPAPSFGPGIFRVHLRVLGVPRDVRLRHHVRARADGGGRGRAVISRSSPRGSR